MVAGPKHTIVLYCIVLYRIVLYWSLDFPLLVFHYSYQGVVANLADTGNLETCAGKSRQCLDNPSKTRYGMSQTSIVQILPDD